MTHPTIDDIPLQVLLDSEALFSNSGRMTEHDAVEVLIRHRIKDKTPPPCFGEDDCSTEVLSHCPWRIDCGK